MNPTEAYRNYRARLALIGSWGLAPKDLVLEVGSGHNPSLRADVLCERFVSDGSERHGQPTLVDRPLVVGDVARLPFRDHAFDFVVCSHLLEHLPDPARAVGELARVAPRGYIEVPSAVNEKLLSYPFHLWYIRLEGEVLVFVPKTVPDHDPELRRWMDALAGTLPGFSDFFFRNVRALGNVLGRVWEGHQLVRIEGPPPGADVPGFIRAEGRSPDEEMDALRRLDGPASGRTPLSRRVDRLLSTHLRRRSSNRAHLWDLIACPRCGGALTPSGEEAVCGCGTHYPRVRIGAWEVPVLLP